MAHGHHEAQASEHGAHGAHRVPPTTVREYVFLGLFLTIVTAIEFVMVELEIVGIILIPALIILTAAKFLVVVIYFMHLRWDHPLLTRLFTFAFLLATALLFALIALFWLEHNTSFNI